MRNLLTEYSPLQDSKHSISPSRKRRTLGNIDEFDDRSWIYSSIKDSGPSTHQKPYLINPDYSKLVEENERLKREVQRLQSLVLHSEKSEKDL